jgi:BlaI family transcriptional regulator, penicillinase repressor
MSKRERDVTGAELAILQILWEEGAVPVRRLLERLYASGGPSAHATVQKLLERLEAKGCITRDRGGPLHLFSAAISRKDLIDRRLRAVSDELCGGSLAAMLSHLVNPRKLAPKDRRVLRDFFQQLEQEQSTEGGDQSPEG